LEHDSTGKAAAITAAAKRQLLIGSSPPGQLKDGQMVAGRLYGHNPGRQGFFVVLSRRRGTVRCGVSKLLVGSHARAARGGALVQPA
jgi:hypothetical protein